MEAPDNGLLGQLIIYHHREGGGNSGGFKGIESRGFQAEWGGGLFICR